MKHVRRHDDVRVADPAASVPAAAPDPDVLRLRMLHRAAAELRRGTPVLLTGEAPLVLLAAETAGPRGLIEFAALAAEPPVLLLAPVRAAAVLHRPLQPGARRDGAAADRRIAGAGAAARPGRPYDRAVAAGRSRSRRRCRPWRCKR